MTPNYAKLCMKFPVITQEELQVKWNHPVKVKMDKQRVMLVATMISTEDGKFLWHSAIRVLNFKKNTVKETAVWMASERSAVNRQLVTELDGVGHSEITYFTSKYAVHASKDLTHEELVELEKQNPNIAAAKIVPFIEKPKVQDKVEVPVIAAADPEFDPNWLDKKS